MNRHRSLVRLVILMVRLVAGAVVVRRLSHAASAPEPVRPASTPTGSISVVVPARDEAARIGPLLEAIVGAPGVDEVIVVDDQSTDRTAEVASRDGVRVITGTDLPPGWAGKAWALQQGITAARGDWVVTLDADTRPDPELPSAAVARATTDGIDLLTLAGRFDCPTPGSRWLHPAMLTTLVYRFGAPGAPLTADRLLGNGQCMVVDRRRFIEAGGMEPVRADTVEDVALARHLARAGWTVGFLDASDLLTVRMFESFGDTLRGWGRSLALPGVETRRRQLLDLAVIALTQVLPLARVASRRADVVDIALLAVRVGTLVGTRRAYTRTDAAYWASPLADPVAAAAIAAGIARGRRQTWRGRTYG
ncbi:MAG: glycosyltransferase [Ilumatobacteraceae bacterium]